MPLNLPLGTTYSSNLPLEYESYTICDLEFVFDRECNDEIIKTLRQVGQCPNWACVSCVRSLFNLISAMPYMTSKVIPQSSVIVDIGCHIGTYSLPLAKQGHSIIAIDGSVESIACLGEAKKRNNIENITTLNKIISNNEEVCTFYPKSSPYSTINDEIGREYWRNRNYIQTTTTIDKLFSSKLSEVDQCDMIKIDIEGYEQEAIEGAVDTITKYKPLLLLEINTLCLHNRHIKPNAVFAKLVELGYDILFPKLTLDPPPTSRNNLSSYIEFIPVDPDDIFPFRVANILCFPKGKKPSEITLSPMRSTEHLYQILKENYTPKGPFSSYFRSLIYEENGHNPFTNPK